MNTAIILAAGQGTRMNSQTAKVLHKVGNKSLLQHVIDASRPLVNSINVIIGHHSESVKKTTSNEDINWVNQKSSLEQVMQFNKQSLISMTTQSV